MAFEKIDGRGYRFSHDVCAIENMEISLYEAIKPLTCACLNISTHYSTIISGCLVKSRLRAVWRCSRSKIGVESIYFTPARSNPNPTLYISISMWPDISFVLPTAHV